MTYDELESIWLQAPNRPGPEAEARLKQGLLDRVRRRRRMEIAWLAWTFLAQGAFTAIVAKVLLTGGATPLRAVSAVPLGLLPWLVLAVRFHQQRRRARAALTLSTVEALRAALEAHRAVRARLRIFAALWVLFVPIFVLLMLNLRTTGQARPSELASMGAVLGSALLASAGFAAWRWFARLRPEGARLEALLAAFEDRT